MLYEKEKCLVKFSEGNIASYTFGGLIMLMISPTGAFFSLREMDNRN